MSTILKYQRCLILKGEAVMVNAQGGRCLINALEGVGVVCRRACRRGYLVTTALSGVVFPLILQMLFTNQLSNGLARITRTRQEIDTELKSYAYNDVQDFACIIKDSEPISWAEIQSNVFLHRNRKTKKTDEIMVCTCMPPINGSLGCGDQCLNKMLIIECVRDTCPCGDRCSNQTFQKHKYAKLELSSCGNKGAGLKLLESVSKGQFLIEYVGEVLDQTAYEARQRSYASMGHKHFY